MSDVKNSVTRIGLTGSRGVLGQSIRMIWQGPEWSCFPGDVTSGAEITNWLKSAGTLDAVIHFAARVPTVDVERDPLQALRVNVEGTINLLEAIRAIQAQAWVFIASTSHVYASSDKSVNEASPLNPISLYGLTKLQAEQWAESYRNRFNLSLCAGRIFSYASPLQAKSYFIPSLVERIRSAPEDAKLEIPGLLGQRDFLSELQVCEAVRFLCQKRVTGIINVASGRGLVLADVATRVREKLGRSDVRIEPLQKGTANLIADVAKLSQIGLQLKFDLDALLDRMLVSPAKK